jgi:Tol biopolymer transport system component
LTTPSEGIWDLQPAVSPDGRSIVFIRELVWTQKDLYLLRLSVTGEPRGEPQRLTFENDRLYSPVWSADGRSVLYSYAGYLWQIDAGTPGKGIQLMSWGEPNANPDFDVSYRANRLVFEQGQRDPNIYRIEKSDSGVFGRPEKLIASTRDDRGGEYSPDGQKIAFVSGRSGFWEVWICDRDGRNEFPLTNFSGPIGGAPAWSPEGSRIAYDSRMEGPSHIYVTSSTGGPATKLTNDYDTMPYWSRDGKWIYYTGGYAGRARALWKIPAGGGGAVFVVDDGIRGKEDYDGRFLYYWKGAGSRSAPDRSGGIWRMPIKGGKEEFFLDTIDLPICCFDVVRDGIFFFSEKSSSGSSFLSFHSFASGKVEPVVEVARPISTLSATPDGRSVLFTQMDQEGYDLILLENFHGTGEARGSKLGRRSSTNRTEARSKQRDSMSGRVR